MAVFNDVIRDGLKGSVFEQTGRGYINGAASANTNKVIFGINGGQGMSQGWSTLYDLKMLNKNLLIKGRITA